MLFDNFNVAYIFNDNTDINIFTMMIIMMKTISIMIPSETMMIMMMMRMIFTAFLVQKQWRWTVFDDCQDWWNNCSICCFTGNVSYFIVRPRGI